MNAGLGEQMIKCVNCPEAAVYTVSDPGANPLDYCATCLPQWLRARASTGHFPLAEASKAKKKAAAPVEEESTVEEAPVDESN
jgi:hypothetical protein